MSDWTLHGLFWGAVGALVGQIGMFLGLLAYAYWDERRSYRGR